MWKSDLTVIITILPLVPSILDRFHISAQLSGAAGAMRRGAVTHLDGSHGKRSAGAKLKNIRWSVLGGGRRARGHGAAARAWMVEESFEHFWSYRSHCWAMCFLYVRAGRALKSRVQPLHTVARMLISHLEVQGRKSCSKTRLLSSRYAVLNRS